MGPSEYSLWILFYVIACFFLCVDGLKEKCAILHVHTRQAITSTDDIDSCFVQQRFRKGILMAGHQSCVIVGKPLVSEVFFS